MKNHKTDQRSLYTRAVIKKSLLKLAAQKPLNKITIAELCADAGTNRITFYNHFYDIFDVYETIENDFYKEIIEKLAHLKVYDAEDKVLREVLLQLYQNIDRCRLLINRNSTAIARVINAVHERYIAEITLRCAQIPLDVLNALFTFQVNGFVGLITDWIKNETPQSPEELGRLLARFNKLIIDGIIGQYMG
jgi:AcrR family transcriptional regulator